jgi:ISXO2-like transposase domain
MASEMKGLRLGGEGKKVEIDGAYLGGYVKAANHRANHRARRLLRNHTGKRQCIIVMRERDGQTLPAAFPSETAALSYIRSQVALDTEMHADDASARDALHGRYVMKRIDHQVAYSLEGANTNAAESFLSRMRRAEVGHHHHMAGTYLARYAQESAWKEKHRRMDNGAQVGSVVALAVGCRPSVDFCGYWQRAFAV